jgi:hypothetical protein
MRTFISSPLTYHIIDILLNSVVIIDVNLVKEYGQVDVFPHVVIMLDVMIKPIGPAFKLMASNITNETKTSLVLLGAKLKKLSCKHHY